MRFSILSYMTCAVGLGLLAGCPDRSISKVTPVQTGAVTKGIPVEADIDILFVVDNSASTADKQALFGANFPNFVAALDAFPSGRPNLHIGVVSTTVGTGSDIDFGAGCPKVATGDDGLLVNTGRVMTGCAAPNGRFISDIKSGATRNCNYGPTCDTTPAGEMSLASTFSCIATLGTTGCGFEMQLEAMRKALNGSNAQNAGFLRNGAYLAVIFLTDEDDASVKDPSVFSLMNVGPGDFRVQPLYAYKCDKPISATGGDTYTGCKPTTGGYLHDTSEYYTFLTTQIGKDPSQVVVAAIAGTDNMGNAPDPTGFTIMTGGITFPFTQPLALEPSCMTTISGGMAISRPGLRISDFISQFGSRGKYYTVCQGDYSQALKDIGTQLFNAISPCLEGPVDTSTFSPMETGQGMQCTVSDIQNFGSTGQTEMLIPPCTMQAGANSIPPDMCNTGPCPASSNMLPCWYVVQNMNSCQTTQTHLELHVVRNQPPAIGTTEVVSCATASM
jgi:hypothetical protein